MRPDSVLTISAQEGDNLSVVGDTYRVVLSGKQTNHKLAIIDMMVPPGGGPGPHAHADIVESFYVVEGEVVFYSDTQTYTARTGDTVTIPMGGAVHQFKNESDKVAHLLCTVAPSGLDAMFEQIGQPVAAGAFMPPPPMTPERMEDMKKVAQQYGQELFPPDYFEKK